MSKIIIKGIFLFLITCLSLFSQFASASSSLYEKKLAPELLTDDNFCKWTDCTIVIPGVTEFKGQKHYVEAYKDKKLIGYAILANKLDNTVGYSSKPIITLIGMDVKGLITGISILKHSEPILLGGIPEIKVINYLKQYTGLTAHDRFEIASDTTRKRIDAISGATVTIIAENHLIARSVAIVSRELGIVKAEKRVQAQFKPSDKILSWDDLQDNGSLSHILVKNSDIRTDGNNKPYLDLYVAYLNAPETGKSLMGEREYKGLMETLKPNEHAIVVLSNGAGSFKGSGFVRGGIFDRILVKQDLDSYTFRDTDFQNIWDIKAKGAPKFSESAIFIIRDKSFSGAYPWSFVYLGNSENLQTRIKTFKTFETVNLLPDEYFVQGTRPEIVLPQAQWVQIWSAKKIQITFFSLWLVAILFFFITRDKWLRKTSRKDKLFVSIPKYISWAIAVFFVGFYLMAQPSITQIFNIANTAKLLTWDWSLYLLDPFLFIFWWFILITTIIWGRGLFCGWMCPFGSLSEGIYKIFSKTPLKKWQKKPPAAIHSKLKWLKYIIFIVLVLVSIFNINLAETLAEVEPFKTTYLVGILNRTWPFGLFVIALLVISIFIERPFCKYLCPLGAGLAFPSILTRLRLRRKSECLTCHACAKGCGALAIDEKGKIDTKECLQCMDCMVMYYDSHACPPLAKERKRRERNNLPLTKIDGKGYFIPIKVETL